MNMIDRLFLLFCDDKERNIHHVWLLGHYAPVLYFVVLFVLFFLAPLFGLDTSLLSAGSYMSGILYLVALSVAVIEDFCGRGTNHVLMTLFLILILNLFAYLVAKMAIGAFFGLVIMMFFIIYYGPACMFILEIVGVLAPVLTAIFVIGSIIGLVLQ